jgi:hypothetical protein
MRLLLRAAILLALATAACKEAVTPVDFKDPVALSANLSAVDSAVNTDVARSFSTATLNLSAATAPAIGPVAALVATARPQLQRSGAQMFLPGLVQARSLQTQLPNLSVAAAQGRVIPDSLYGRVYEWDTTIHGYTWQGTTVTGLTGVRFVLYAVGLDDQVIEPVTAIGTLDILDQSTASKLQVQVLVKGPGGSPTYIDYTISLQPNGQMSATAAATGSISNGLTGGANKTLSFDQTITIDASSATAHAAFALNNPAITVIMNESVVVGNPNIVINADFRLIQNGLTIQAVGRVTVNTTTGSAVVTVTVNQDGHPVASINGDPSDPATQWKDAGGQPLTVNDLAALDHLFRAFEAFQKAVEGLFLPVTTFAGL